MYTKILQYGRAAVGTVIGLLAVLLIVLVIRPANAHVEMANPTAHLGTEDDLAFVFRFDPQVQSYQVFTIPTRGAVPWGVAAASRTAQLDIWFTEAGANRIGRLVYTETNDFSFQEYELAAGSEPRNIVVDGDDRVWFTEAGRNRIGRLDPATGQIAEFAPPTPNSRPSDLALATDGSVWFTQMAADQIARLEVDLAGSYTVTEYSDPFLSGGRPYGIVVAASSVYLAQTENDWITRFTPPSSWAHLRSFILPNVPDEPYELALDRSGVWATERAGNRVSHYDIGTFTIVDAYTLSPPNSMPTGIAVDSDDNLWITQWAAGQIAHMIVSDPPQISHYPLPLPSLAPSGIALDAQGTVWVVASRPHRVYLPHIMSKVSQ